jgi:5-formyltetrahydrofolate cyclo-ligase
MTCFFVRVVNFLGMHPDLKDLKAALRTQALAELGKIPMESRATGSAQACALLMQQPLWVQANSVLLFSPIQGEPDIWPLMESAIAEGKVVSLPRFLPKSGSYAACRVLDSKGDIQPGHFGIREPREHCPTVQLNQLDFVLVPGVAFDVRGCRLGRGRGFYDRLLTAVRGTKCGVAFDQQIVSEIPVEPHDIQLDCILTPTRWIVP